jgi:nucleoid-associated protein YgaU
MFDKDNNTEYTDDLIKDGQEPIIIKEKDSGDKKFIYTILILLVILFIVALAVIGYLGSKFFGNNQVAHTPASNSVRTVNTPVAKASNSGNVDISELESIVNSSTPAKKNSGNAKVDNGVKKAIGVAASATGTKKLSQEEMAKIAQLVAKELAKSQKKTKAKVENGNVAKGGSNSEDALVKSLQEASTDTLQAQKVDVNSVSKSSAKAGSSKKKVDTFNKVVVKKNNNKDDEFAKLSSEIDNILAQDEVKENKANRAIKAQLQDVVKDRKKEMRYIVVREGDTLSSLAHRAYGRASAYIKIYKANPELVKNPNRIYKGMKLRVPVDEEYKEFKGKKR